MPELSRFYGIIIQMYFDDHAPPHFHARYAGSQAVITIDPPTLLLGSIPTRAQGMVIEWAQLHREELRRAWERAQRREPPGKIAPLP